LLADLDSTDERFHNLSLNLKAADSHPAWSPAGGQLAWTTSVEGYQNIILFDFSQPDIAPRTLAQVSSPPGSLTGT